MKKLLSLFIFALLLALAVSAETLNGTKLRNTCADPWLFTHNDFFYLARTGATRIAVHKTETLAELISSKTEDSIAYDAAKDPTVEVLYGTQYPVNGTWSPEIHYFSEEDFGKEYAGWYMFVGLRRQKETGSAYDSEYLRLVVLKSLTDDPAGPYGHPTKGIENYSQPVILANGKMYEEWACGQSILRIPEGEYAGIYTLWVDEVGRGTSGFYQRIRISKLENPWTLTGKEGIVTVPTQDWEFRGSEDGFHPAVVEGGTAVYGKNGDVYIIYSGSGYQSDYGLGQLTWNGGDPLETSSWVKYANNPIFSSKTAANLIGAGHASFLTDESGDGFFCYHAYPAKNGVKDGDRNAYLERYTIDYSANNGIGYGLVRLGEGKPASSSTEVTFDTDGTKLSVPTVYTLGKTFSIKLTIMDSNAEGYILYRSEDGEVFDYLTTVGGTSYTDYDVVKDNTYTYRVYPYRAEEISEAFVEVRQKTTTSSPHTLSATAENETVTVEVYANDNYDKVRLYRSADGVQFGTGIQEVENVRFGETVVFTDTVPEVGTYEYMATGINGGFEYFPASTVSVTVEYVAPAVAAPTISNVKQTQSETVRIEITANADYDGGIRIYHSEDGVTFAQTTNASLSRPVSEGSMIRLPIGHLSAGTHYFYAVGIANGVESAPSEVRSFDVVSLRAPIFTEITATCEGITMTYGGEEAYDGYTIYRFVPVVDEYLGEYLSAEEIATTTESTYTLTDITLGEEYLFGVRGTVNGITTATSTAAMHVTPAHTVEEAEGLAPTCTQAGYTKSATCSVCAEILLAKDPIPATGHNHVLIAEEIPATYESEGKTAVYECTVCGDSYGGDVIPKLYEAGSGDANGDGKISLTDAIRILRMIHADEFSTAADLNADGEITVLDALLLLQKIVNGEV